MRKFAGPFALALPLCLGDQQPYGNPLRACFEDGAAFRWLNKPVLDSRLPDDMENLAAWSFTRGAYSLRSSARPM
jgi:hypothetical protein